MTKKNERTHRTHNQIRNLPYIGNSTDVYMNQKNKTITDVKDNVRAAYEEVIKGEPEGSESQHPGFANMLLVIKGDIQDLRDICLN